MASRCHNGQQLLSPLPNRASSLYSTNEGRKSSATKKKLIRDRGLIKNYQDGSENCPQLTLIQNDRQSLPPIIKSRQGSYLCLNFSSTQNQGFTHRPSASERVTAGVDENIVGLRLNYLALLKDLANAISSSKSLVSDLENVREEQCNVDHSSVSELINYTELPKIDHLLEKCRMETDNLRTVDRRLNCFFKLPPSLQLNFTWTVQALHKVLQDLISSMFYLIEQIVSSEIDNALNSNMNDTESNRTQLNKFRNVCYHIENVYNFNQIVKANGWKQHSEKKGICWKFKRGIKARTPFMYFKESPPNCNMHGVLTHSIISFSSFVKKLTSQRAEVSAMFITKFLCNLLFKEKTISDFDKQTTSLPNGFSSPRYNNSSYTNLADENGNSSTTGHQKKLLNFLRRNQRKLFQLITQIINNETVVFSQIVVDIIQLESSMMSKVSSTRAFFQVKQYLSTHLSTTKDNVHVQPDAPASKSTKRVHFGDAIEPKVYEELQQKYLNMLLMSLNKLVCRTLISECTEKSSLHHFCWIPISCADLDVATHLVHCFLLKKPKSGKDSKLLIHC